MALPTYSGTPQPPAPTHHQAAKGFGQIFGLDPRIAFLTFIIDNMLFAGETVTLGASVVVSVIVAIALGFITYRAQMKWYGDDKESAMIKAGILALLTAIPTSIPAFVYVSSGLVGLVHNIRKK